MIAEVALALVLVLSPGGRALSLPTLPTNDLQQLLALTGVPTPARAPVQSSLDPALAPVPPAVCGPDPVRPQTSRDASRRRRSIRPRPLLAGHAI